MRVCWSVNLYESLVYASIKDRERKKERERERERVANLEKKGEIFTFLSRVR